MTVRIVQVGIGGVRPQLGHRRGAVGTGGGGRRLRGPVGARVGRAGRGRNRVRGPLLRHRRGGDRGHRPGRRARHREPRRARARRAGGARRRPARAGREAVRSDGRRGPRPRRAGREVRPHPDGESELPVLPRPPGGAGTRRRRVAGRAARGRHRLPPVLRRRGPARRPPSARRTAPRRHVDPPLRPAAGGARARRPGGQRAHQQSQVDALRRPARGLRHDRVPGRPHGELSRQLGQPRPADGVGRRMADGTSNTARSGGPAGATASTAGRRRSPTRSGYAGTAGGDRSSYRP